MRSINTLQLQLESRSCNENYARVAVAAFAAQLDPTLEEISELKTAVSEAVTNSIVHGYKEGIGLIYITVKLFEDHRLQVIIRDKGEGIENIELAREPLFTTCGNGERSGMGFTIMETFCDRIRVTSKVGRGTRVLMEKYIQGKDTDI